MALYWHLVFDTGCLFLCKMKVENGGAVMNYNNYTYGYGYPQYSMGYPQYNQVQEQNDIIVKYGTRKEAEPFIVPPTRSAVFLNKVDGEVYVKSTDNMGNSSFATFKQVILSDNPTETQKAVLDPKEFVSRQEFDNLLEKLKELEAKVVSND